MEFYREENIIREEKANSTVENAINVVQMIRDRLSVGQDTAVTLVLVTSAYHVPLTAWCFRNWSLITCFQYLNGGEL